MCDELFDHDALMRRRSEGYLRNMFMNRQGELILPLDAMTRFKEAALRLADGLELRNLRPGQGIHVHQNRNTVITVLKDLDSFFMESNIDYKEHRAYRGGTIHFGES